MDSGWELVGPDPGSEELASVQWGWDRRDESKGPGVGLEGRKVGSHLQVMASISSAPRKLSVGGPPASGRSGPGGAVAARTASQHPLPLRPRAPRLGGNGRRARVFIPAGWGIGGAFPITFSRDEI